MISAKEFAKRRAQLLTKMNTNSCMVLFSGCDLKASEDQTHEFWVNRNFYYLTGITQQNSVLVLVKYTKTRARSILLVDEVDENRVKWMGRMIHKEEAKKISGCESVFYKDKAKEFYESTDLKRLWDIFNSHYVYLDLSDHNFIKQECTTQQFASSLSDKKIKVRNIYEEIVKMRMIKSPAEIEEIKKSIHVTNLGLQSVLKNLAPGKYEYQMSSLFEYTIKDHNFSGLSFPTIAASGENAVILHYPTPTAVMEDKTLLLLDLGAEKDMYRADISRTYPVNGKFTQQQKDIYEMVLRCNKAVQQYIRPGVTLKSCQEFAFDYLKGELITRGYISTIKAHEEANAEIADLMKKDPSKILSDSEKSDIYLKKLNEQVFKYYYHSVGHHLGLDVHDACIRELPLKPGMVITDEPGLYMKEYGIGVRIEDDILVTEDGSINLSSEIIKEVEDIENFMKK